MDGPVVVPRPVTYIFGDCGTGIQDADEGAPLSPSSRSPSSSSGESSPRQAEGRLASGPLRQGRKRPRSWSTTTSTNHGPPFPFSPPTGHDSPLRPGGGPIEPGGSPLRRCRSPVARGESGRGACGRRLSLRSPGADATVPREDTRGRPLVEGGVVLVGRDDDIAAAGEPGAKEKRGSGEAVADDGSLDEEGDKDTAEDEAAYNNGRRGTRGGEEIGQYRGHGSGEKGMATRGAQQQPQQHAVHVVVHEVLSEDFGLFTWPSGVVLAYLIWARRRELRGVSVVEIGAGTALPGLLAAKLGARVLLTDREGAPWVLENMRGAVAANGLAPPAGDSVRDTDAQIDGGAASAVEHGRALGTGMGVDKGEGGSEEEGGKGDLATGSCSVRGLSWGSVGPASIKLAREQWRPQVVLGADVFYSSEHFDGVLATAFMLLSATPPSFDGGGGVDLDATTVAEAASSIPCGVGNGSAGAGAGAGVFSAKDADTPAVTAAAAAAVAGASAEAGASDTGKGGTATVISPPNLPSKRATYVADGRATESVFGSPFSRSRGVFLTAYHERSARRSLRPLLRKWGMEARVLHDAPQKVLPPALWESGRYDSIALLEIALVR